MVHSLAMARGTRLLDRPAEEIAVLLGHPVQRDTARLIAELVTDLRSLSRPEEYYEFQRELGAHVYGAQKQQAAASRNEKRVRAGRDVPPPDALTWALTVVMWDRTVRQLRAVGDAMAWRLFNYDRRFLLALSRNSPAGPMVGKAGLDWELGAVKETWERDGDFALLHDLTNAVRIGDITVFGKSGPMIAEVKRSATAGGSRGREQVRRAQRAVAVINDGAPLPGEQDVDLYVSNQPFKTNLTALRQQLERASSEAIASRSIAHQQVVTALAVTARVDLPIAELLVKTDALKQRAFGKAGLSQVDHHLRGVRADSIGKDAHLAPFTIYPFDPQLVAALTTDLVCYEYTVGWDLLAQAFETHGFAVQLLLDPADGKVPEDVAILHDRRGDRRVTLHSGGLDQLLHELVDVDRFVTAVAAAARLNRPEGRTTSVMTFRNERATWR